MEDTGKKPYSQVEKDFIADVLSLLSAGESEVAERNSRISKLDSYIYGEGLTQALNIPAGHDRTKVNWLRRSVEIHADQFMGNGFQVISTYNSKDLSSAVNDEEKKRLRVENGKYKEFADQRKRAVDSIIEDNGGVVKFKELAENAAAVGTSVAKGYYDEEKKKYVISQIENVENFYVVWSGDDFREIDLSAYAYQISKVQAAKLFNLTSDVPTSPLGQPFKYSPSSTTQTTSTQPMVTVLEITGYVEGWAGKNGMLIDLPDDKYDQCTKLNALIVGDKLIRLITEEKKIPNYYVFPNKRVRRRPWGVSNISDEAIDINLTYIETLSDWRTVGSKVNFPKYKAFGFPATAQLPKPKPRTVELLPLATGQDIQPILQGDTNHIDFAAQIEELEKQFIKETGISRVLFNDPTITLNSNQALMTSMKPTTDIAEAKKALWAPILKQMFEDALLTLAEYDSSIKEIVTGDESWELKVVYPSYIAKYDPSAFSMLINRKNAGLISTQSALEALGESKEELDRIIDEMFDPVSAGILGNQLPMIAQHTIQKEIQREQLALQAEQQQQQAAIVNATGVQPNGKPNQQTAGAQASSQSMINVPGSNTPGAGIMSQAGSGQATPVSAGGAVAMANQNAGA